MNKNLKKLGRKIKAIDIFGEGVQFNLGKDQSD